MAAFRAALEEYTRARVPLAWAQTQNNLGDALRVLGEREADSARLEAAVAAFQAALEEITCARAQPMWEKIQRNLAKVYLALQDEAKEAAIYRELHDASLGYQCPIPNPP